MAQRHINNAEINTSVKDKRAAHQYGFTLIELLLVIGLIALMLSLTWQATAALQNRMARVTAQSELALLAQALEDYRAQYGDYPWVNSHTGAHELYQSLIGNKSPTGHFSFNGETLSPGTDPLSQKRGPAFVTLSAFTLEHRPRPQLPETLDAHPRNAFIDPWGQPYIYQYKNIGRAGKVWRRPGPILMSKGKDAEPYPNLPANGLLKRYMEDKRTADNLFAF